MGIGFAFGKLGRRISPAHKATGISVDEVGLEMEIMWVSKWSSTVPSAMWIAVALFEGVLCFGWYKHYRVFGEYALTQFGWPGTRLLS